MTVAQELWNIRSQDCSFPRLFVPTVELSFSGTNLPGNEWSRERKLFHHGDEESWERIVLRTNLADTVAHQHKIGHLVPYLEIH